MKSSSKCASAVSQLTGDNSSRSRPPRFLLARGPRQPSSLLKLGVMYLER